MSREIRSRRADASVDKPLYARILRVRHLSPSGFLCFVFLEGSVALGILLALAELVSWWGVVVLPVTVAVMVKLNDVVAGLLGKPVPAARPAAPARPHAWLRPAVVQPPVSQSAPPSVPPSISPSVPPSVRRPGEVTDDLSLSRAKTADLRGLINSDARETVTNLDANALNGPPVARPWGEDAGLREQRDRQSAARRYE